jgi:hypothetical protein
MKPSNSETIIKQQRAHRYESLAQVNIHGFDGWALLRNVNGGGFCFASKTYVAISRNERYKMRIMPEPAAGLPDIDLDVTVIWMRVSEHLFAAGFRVLQSSPAFRQYLAYLENRPPSADSTPDHPLPAKPESFTLPFKSK